MKALHISLTFIAAAGVGCAARKQQVQLSPPVVITMQAATNFMAGTNLVHEQRVWAVTAAPAPAPGQKVYPGQNVGAAPVAQTDNGAEGFNGQVMPKAYRRNGHTYGPRQYDGWVYSYPGEYGGGYGSGYGGYGPYGSAMIYPDPYRTGRDYYYLSAPYSHQVHIQGGGLGHLLGRHKKCK